MLQCLCFRVARLIPARQAHMVVLTHAAIAANGSYPSIQVQEDNQMPYRLFGEGIAAGFFEGDAATAPPGLLGITDGAGTCFWPWAGGWAVGAAFCGWPVAAA